jgi:chromosome segregation ATPase
MAANADANESEVLRLKMSIESLESELASMKEAKASADEMIEPTESRIETLIGELKSMTEQKSEMLMQLCETQKAFDALRSESSTRIEAFTHEIEELQSANNASQLRASSLASENGIQSSRICHAENESSHLISKFEKSDRKKQTHAERLSQLEATFVSAKDQWQCERDQLDNTISTSQTKIRELTEANGEARKQIASLERARNRLKEKNAKLESTQSDLEAELSSLQESRLRLQSEKDESVSKLFSALSEIANLQQAHLSLEAEISRADAELRSCKSTLSELAASNSNLEEEIARLQSERGTLTKQLEEQENTMTALKEKITQLTDVEWRLHRNFKRVQKEATKTKTRIRVLMRTACPEALEQVPEDYDLVRTANEFLQNFPIHFLARATTIFSQKMNTVHQRLDDTMARLVRLEPKLMFPVELCGQYGTHISEMTKIIDKSLPCTTVAAALEKILGLDPNYQSAVDQLHVQQLFEQVQKKMKDVVSRALKALKSPPVSSPRTTPTRRP